MIGLISLSFGIAEDERGGFKKEKNSAQGKAYCETSCSVHYPGFSFPYLISHWNTNLPCSFPGKAVIRGRRLVDIQ